MVIFVTAMAVIGALAIIFSYYVCCYVNKHRRPPNHTYRGTSRGISIEEPDFMEYSRARSAQRVSFREMAELFEVPRNGSADCSYPKYVQRTIPLKQPIAVQAVVHREAPTDDQIVNFPEIDVTDPEVEEGFFCQETIV